MAPRGCSPRAPGGESLNNPRSPWPYGDTRYVQSRPAPLPRPMPSSETRRGGTRYPRRRCGSHRRRATRGPSVLSRAPAPTRSPRPWGELPPEGHDANGRLAAVCREGGRATLRRGVGVRAHNSAVGVRANLLEAVSSGKLAVRPMPFAHVRVFQPPSTSCHVPPAATQRCCPRHLPRSRSTHSIAPPSPLRSRWAVVAGGRWDVRGAKVGRTGCTAQRQGSRAHPSNGAARMRSTAQQPPAVGRRHQLRRFASRRAVCASPTRRREGAAHHRRPS